MLAGAVLGCGGDDTRDGDGSGFEQLAARSCERQIQEGCADDAWSCEDGLVSSQEMAEALECGEAHRAYVECTAENAWVCDPGSVFPMVATPPACDELKAAYESCNHDCTGGRSAGGEDFCRMSCQFDGHEVELTCPEGMGECACSAGPKAGAALTLASCGYGEMVKRLEESCR